MQERIEKAFWYSVVFTLAIKLMLAASIPITSDEAYFAVWANHLDFGYYDHPPMAGWFLVPLVHLGRSVLLVRLPAVLSTILIGIGIYFVLKAHDRLKAALIGIFFLLSPFNILNVLISTDTPLIIFSFFSAVFLHAALNRKGYALYLASGIFLGLAFLSKYFAALLGFSYLVYLLFSERSREKTVGFLILFAAAVPFVALNVYWNYTHCWANVMFNLFNRNREETFSLGKFLLFVVSQLYLMTPPVVYFLLRRRKEAVKAAVDRGFLPFLFAFLVPLGIFALLSFKKTVGLHWVLAFYPFMYLLLYSLLTETELVKSIKFIFFFSAAHLLLIGTVLSLPVELFKSNRNYPAIVMGTNPGALILRLRQYEGEYHFATPSYAQSAVISFYYGRYFSVFGGGSHHGRQDDIITDYRALAGKNILILRDEPPGESYAPYFTTVETKEVAVRGARFFIVLGRGFDYEIYRDRVLRHVSEQYYAIPPYLPVGSCYFSKYFPR